MAADLDETPQPGRATDHQVCTHRRQETQNNRTAGATDMTRTREK